MRSRQKALLVADLARSKKAEDIVVLDMRKISNITDFFIILTAGSTKRAQTITDNIENGLRKADESLSNIEGYQEARWILVDAYDVVTHVFTGDLRRFYNLEGLWGDAPKVRLCQKKRKTRSKKSSKRK
ncbi:MAG: ribosome silencing factor [Candidatus Omnitrophica bacterium]|nr:ribosome silencing factor [Candidatus Omnitrophota bacterium]